MRRSPFARLILAGLAALLLAAPLAAYTIYMKDGSSIQAREKYRIEGARAIITLFNGTQTFVPAGNIDVKKTDEGNKVDYGHAQVIPGAPTEIAPSAGEQPREKSMRDLMGKGGAVRDLPEVKRARPTGPVTGPAKTASGYIDLMTWGRKPYANVDIVSELKRALASQGIEEVEIFDGTKGDRPFLEITTNSEGAVFKTLAGVAAALPLVRQSYPKVAAFELLLVTAERDRAGQFVLTPEVANQLLSKKIDLASLTSFYVKNVQF